MSTSMSVVVIDAQVGLLEKAYRAPEVVARIRGLIQKAREARVPVIYLQHDGDEGETLAPGAPDWQIHPGLTPGPEDVVLRKRASDSFYQTNLEQELTDRAIGCLVIAGLRTERCVDTTARRAVSMGFDVILAADAHTTTDSKLLTAAQIIAHTNENLDDFGTDEHVVLVKDVAAITL